MGGKLRIRMSGRAFPLHRQCCPLKKRRVSRSLPHRGRWHGGAVTEGVNAGFHWESTPSVASGDSSLNEGALS